MVDVSITSLIESFEELLPKETSYAIADPDHFIYYKPSKIIDLKIRPGDKINENTVTYQALAVQRKMSQKVSSQVFGVPYFGTSVPILDEGNPKGCVTAILPASYGKPLSNVLTVRTGDTWKPTTLQDIIYLEAQNRKTWVQSVKGMGTNKYTLSELEFLLPDETFLRCHRSYIINVHYIEEIQPDSHSTFLLIMKDGLKVPVSQTYARVFRKRLGF
ncbi:LytTR family DNA-binding domain-containing protein [Alteribacillus iranensis]|uniref:LytTr DNA-binding domain-containing protein n=1 Tax=Alteribacillus iranensis TaxID=930128 RepID=A0A1I2DR23_9BACI|nr:LytTR family DNA-binding domain-containing protein [Alteribacillus iranensis]SFE83052.1 LytTr DNA-binding domain-containing protein [Alteribacillus iranensis]